MPDAGPDAPLASIDTNVLVSGLSLRKGWPYMVFRARQENRIQLVVSVSQFAELADVFQRDHLYQKYEITVEQAQDLLSELANIVVADGTAIESIAIRDSDDIVILATANELGDEFLITGDQDLLATAEAASSFGLQIVTPRQFGEKFNL